MLTLLINATTIKYFLDALGMSDISNARKITMATAVKRVRDAQSRAISMLKSDRFLADANWNMVERSTLVEDPYQQKTKVQCTYTALLWTPLCQRNVSLYISEVDL